MYFASREIPSALSQHSLFIFESVTFRGVVGWGRFGFYPSSDGHVFGSPSTDDLLISAQYRRPHRARASRNRKVPEALRRDSSQEDAGHGE